jgi:urate oxidase
LTFFFPHEISLNATQIIDTSAVNHMSKMAQREDVELLKSIENSTNYYFIDEDKTQPQNTRRTYARPQRDWKV